MEMKELKDKSEAELHKLLAAEREKLRDMRFNVSIAQLKTVRQIRETRRLIARILTLVAGQKKEAVGAKIAATPVKVARDNTYKAVGENGVNFHEMQFRADIAGQALTFT